MISYSEMSVVNKESALEVGWEGKEGLFKNLRNQTRFGQIAL